MARQAARSFVRRPLFITVATLAVLIAAGVAGYRNVTEPRYAQVLEIREVDATRQRCSAADQAADAQAAQTDCRATAQGVPETAFDVRYRLGAREDVIRLPYDPGQRIPVEDGKLVLEPPAK